MPNLTLDNIAQIIPPCKSNRPELPRDMKPAGVLVLMFTKNGSIHVILNKRSDTVEHHKGEISFPGGAWEPADKDLSHTATRETNEEMGIRYEDMRLIGELDTVNTSSMFCIYPFVATLNYPYKSRVSEAEVADVLEVPIQSLVGPLNRRSEMHIRQNKSYQFYSYIYNEHIIHGATARILSQLLAIIAKKPT
jgi:8-oxo-dGTP pyrophosphatase MutT (NUDIX family)